MTIQNAKNFNAGGFLVTIRLCLLLILIQNHGRAENIIPRSFANVEQAIDYANNSFAGSSVKIFKINNEEYMTLIIHGSGVPDLAIAAYKKEEGNWEFVSEGERLPSARHSIIQKENKLIVTDGKGFESILIEVVEKE